MAKIKVTVSEYPKREILSSNLFGQGLKMRGVDNSTLVQELRKLSFRMLHIPTFVKSLNENPELRKQFISFVCFQNEIVVTQVLRNIKMVLLENPDEEIVRTFGNLVFQLILTDIPRSVKYGKIYFETTRSWFFPGAEALQPIIPRHRAIGKLYARDLKPKLSAETFNRMYNWPADPANGKMELVSAIPNNKRIFKETKKTLRAQSRSKHLSGLLEQCVSGNPSPGIESNLISGTDLIKLRADDGTRAAIRKKNNTIELVAVWDKNNEKKIYPLLRKDSPDN